MPKRSAIFPVMGLISLLLALPDDLRLFGPATYMPRTGSRSRFEPLGSSTPEGLIIAPDGFEPLTLGLYSGDATWSGYGLRAYKTPALGRSPIWRAGTEAQGLPLRAKELCEQTGGHATMLVMGERGSTISVEGKALELNGAPQEIELSIQRCDGALLQWDGHGVAPFLQLAAGGSAADAAHRTGLAFESSLESGHVILNLWYSNPDVVRFDERTELRLFRTDAAGAGPDGPESARWWSGPLVLSVERQLARVEFDGLQLMVNGEPSGAPMELPAGSYLLALTVAGGQADGGEFVTRRLIPLASLTSTDGLIGFQSYAGIVTLDSP